MSSGSSKADLAAKAYAQKYPYIKPGARLFCLKGPLEVRSVSADPSGKILVACSQGKPYDGAYFALYASRTNDPASLVEAYQKAARSTWWTQSPEALLSPDDASIAPHARQAYGIRCQNDRATDPYDSIRDIGKLAGSGKADEYGYAKPKGDKGLF